MTTLVLPPLYTEDSIALWRAALEAGWQTERLAGWRVPETLKGRDVVLYGEPLFAAVVAEELGVALLEPPADWLARLAERYRRRAVRHTTLAEARRLTEPAFVKPAEEKCFPARVYRHGGELPAEEVLPGLTPVLIAEPVFWEAEFRCFVLQGEVQTLSIYLRNGELARAEDGSWPSTEGEIGVAREFAAAVLHDRDLSLPPAVVLDVGRIQGRGWAVVEANAAWGSGLYGCEPGTVLRVVQRACVTGPG
jgi:hypothetical protein